MKMIKITSKLAAGLLALGIVSQASADPVVYLTGSTAFRATVYAALYNNGGTNGGGVFDTNSVTAETWGNAAANGGSYMVFHGTISGSGVYINCAWSGSEAGIAAACNTSLQNVDRNGNSIPLAGSPETWVNATNPGVVLTYPVTINSGAPGALLESSSHGADLAQADTSQAVSFTPFVANTVTALKDYGKEGVVTFAITKNNQTGATSQTGASNEWANLVNVTLPELNTLFHDGAESAGFFTGNTNDSDMEVYLVGRNKGSGTRMNMLSDSTYGGQRGIQQFSIGYGIEESGPVNSLVLTNEGNGGYESGGSVAKAMSIAGTSGSCGQADPFNGGVGWFALAYLGPSDALSTANNLNANGSFAAPTNCWVTVDGVPSNNGTIEKGQWWYWGYEHLLGKYQISGTQDTVGSILFKAVDKTIFNLGYGTNSAASDPAILSAAMRCTKSSDTAFPSPSY